LYTVVVAAIPFAELEVVEAEAPAEKVSVSGFL